MQTRRSAITTVVSSLAAGTFLAAPVVEPSPDLGPYVRVDADPIEGRPAPTQTFDQHVVSFPDEVGANVGGVAARLHVDGRRPVSGDLFALFAKDGSDAHARVYDATPYTLIRSTPHPDMAAANATAAAVVGAIIGNDFEVSELTSAPAGGFSAGLTYAIGYLNAVSDGAFTGDLRIASTGALDDDGYIDRVTAIDEKVAAAHLAEVDVMFTSTTPSYTTVDAYASRYEGDLVRARRTGLRLTDERHFDSYEQLGQQRQDSAMDLIAVAHLGDVAAYLCGAGSIHACAVRSEIGATSVEPTTTGVVENPGTNSTPLEHADHPGIR